MLYFLSVRGGLCLAAGPGRTANSERSMKRGFICQSFTLITPNNTLPETLTLYIHQKGPVNDLQLK